MASAKTDIEKDDLTKQYKKDVATINGSLSREVGEYKAKKRAIYDANKAKEQEAYDKAIQDTTDPKKLADFERHHKEVQDKWDIDKENKKKMEQFNRSDYMRRAEIDREDPNKLKGLKKLLFKGKQEKKVEAINKRYDAYNKKNIK